MKGAQILKCLDVPVQSIRMSFQVFRTSDFVHFLLSMKVFTILSKMRTYSKFCFLFVHVSFGIQIRASRLVGSWLHRQFVVFIVLDQKLTSRPLLISSESFIIAKVLQYYSAIPFSLCIYGTTQSIVILFSLQKLLNVALINSHPSLVCKHPSFSPQALACDSQS